MVKKLFMFAAAALAFGVVPGTASGVDYVFSVAGFGEGKLEPRDGGYSLYGKFVDEVSGRHGQIRGEFTELTTGFTSCPYTGISVIFCTPENSVCNLLDGEVTFALGSARATAILFVGPSPEFRIRSTLCLTDTPGVLNLHVWLTDEALGPVISFGSLSGRVESHGDKLLVSFEEPLFGTTWPIEYRVVAPESAE